MSTRQLNIILRALFISAVFVVAGCKTTTYQPPRTVYQPARICYRDSKAFNLSFEFPCEQNDMARIAVSVCDIMGASAYTLIECNRRIGPTTPQNLLYTALPEIEKTTKVFYDVLGENVAKAYINEIADMGYYIAQRNITDLVTYPKQKCKSCLEGFDYVVN
jgi:hypothetical protein